MFHLCLPPGPGDNPGWIAATGRLLAVVGFEAGLVSSHNSTEPVASSRWDLEVVSPPNLPPRWPGGGQESVLLPCLQGGGGQWVTQCGQSGAVCAMWVVLCSVCNVGVWCSVCSLVQCVHCSLVQRVLCGQSGAVCALCVVCCSLRSVQCVLCVQSGIVYVVYVV